MALPYGQFYCQCLTLVDNSKKETIYLFFQLKLSGKMASGSEGSIVVTQSKWNNFRSISVVFGGILVHLTLGTLYSYGKEPLLY